MCSSDLSVSAKATAEDIKAIQEGAGKMMGGMGGGMGGPPPMDAPPMGDAPAEPAAPEGDAPAEGAAEAAE